jgi:membrane-associated phospholipid phosphatase
MILLLAPLVAVFFKPLLRFDHWLFHKINQVWISPFFDLVLPFLRQPEFWCFFYLFLLVFILYNFGIRGCWWAVTLIMTGIIADLFSSSVVKNFIFRFRPCRNPELADQVRVLVNYCPYSSSFTSSHACNHFAAAWFIFITLNQTGSWRWVLFLWASVVSYAQIYVGVHFPLDILGGAILGSSIGLAMSKFFKMQFGALSLN